MNTEDFEKKLARQPLKPIPGEWRQEILRAARNARRANQAQDRNELSIASAWATFYARLSALLWPCPQAWAGLAVIWAGILGLHISMREDSPPTSIHTIASSRQVTPSLAEERRLLAELLGPNDSLVADKPRPPAPRPQSRNDQDRGFA